MCALEVTLEKESCINLYNVSTKKTLLFLAGPFTSLNAEEIDNEVGDMWRTMYKLTKTFGDQPGPRRIADSVKGKIDKFKQHLPILHTICNPGIRDRHWEAVSEVTYFVLHKLCFIESFADLKGVVG